MKKNLLSILALGGLLFATSCQMDEPDAGTLTGEVDFSITAGIPSGITTYAEGADAFSHQGGARNLNTSEYTLRYTLQVFDNDGKLAYEGVEYAEDFGGVTFEARLLAKVYDFVFWADFIQTEGQDLYYNTEDLRKISYTSSVTDANIPSDALDAYYKKEVVDLTQAGQNISNVVLNRPFGKIRFVATDELSEQQKGAVDNGKVSVAYKEGTVLPNVFDAQTGKATISQEYHTRMSDFTATPVAEKASVNSTFHENAYLLGYDYIFCSESQPSYAMDVTVSIDGVSPVTRSLSSIPIQENKLTTVIGNFYTNEGSIDVIVEDEFGNGENLEDVPVETTASTLEEAESALEKLAADPTTGGKDIVITIPNTPASGDNFDAIEMPALSNNVTIVFEGGISAAGLTINDVLASGTAGNDFTGNLTIKNNSTEQQGKLIINLPEGSCTLDGGSYSSVDVTTADNTFVVGEYASIKTLTVNNGNVKLYGTIESLTKAQGYSGTIYRCLSTQKSLENLLSDNVSGYEKILIEIPATIDGGTSKPTLAKPVDIYADANISNLEICFEGNGSSPVNIYDGALNVNLSNVKMSTTNEYSICKLMGSNLNFKAVDCEFILTQGKSNQSGLNIQNGGTGNVISAELDGCYIGFYNYEDRINKDLSVDYDYPSDFKWSSYSRGITTGNNSGKTYDGTATTNLTIKNTFIEGAYYAINTLHNIKLTVDVENSVLDGRAGFNIWTTSEQPSYFNVRNSKLIGRNGFSGPTEEFATIVVNDYNNNDLASFKWVRNINITLDQSDIVSDNNPQTETNRQYAADIRTTEKCTISFLNSTKVREIKNPRLDYMVNMTYWNSEVVDDGTTIVDGKEGALLVPQSVWDGKRKTKPQEAIISITESSLTFHCYQIVEPSDLYWFAEQVNNGSEEVKGKSLYFVRDLDLGGHEWIPIGYNGNSDINMNEGEYAKESMFSGSIFGNGITIKNAVINVQTTARGIFGQVYGDGKNPTFIFDINAENVHIKQAGKWSGGLFGYIRNVSQISGCSIKDVTIESGNNPLSYYLGGLIGYISSTDDITISDCSSENISFPGPETWNCGGFIGKIFNCQNVLIEDCEASKGYMKSSFYLNGYQTGYTDTYYLAKDGYQNSWFIGNLTNTAGFNLVVNNVPDNSSNWTESDSYSGGVISLTDLEKAATAWPYIGVMDNYSNPVSKITIDGTIVYGE